MDRRSSRSPSLTALLLVTMMGSAGAQEKMPESFKEPMPLFAFGLEQALRAQGRTGEAADIRRAFEAAWARADVGIRSSRF